MNYSRLKLALIAASVLYGAAVNAAEVEANFSGFATVAYGKTLTDASEGDVENINSEGSYNDFNKFGVRFDAEVTENLRITTQVVANGVDEYQPKVDWFFATYNIIPNLDFSAGRMRVPLFMFSDFLDVGYAYQWISPPDSVYGIPNFRSFDGIKLAWNADLGGDWNSEVLVWGGNVDEYEEALNSNIEIKDSVGIAWTIDRDWLMLRSVYYEGTSSADIVPLLTDMYAGLDMIEAATGVSMDGVKKDMAFDEESGPFLGLGVFMDFEHTFYAAEATLVDIDKTVAVGEFNSFYIMGGVRLPSDWSLSLTYSSNDDQANPDVYKQLLDLTAPFAGTAIEAAVDGIVEGIEDFSYEQSHVYALGSRWDFHPSAALKMEYLHREIDEQYSGVIGTKNPKAYRIAVDFIF